MVKPKVEKKTKKVASSTSRKKVAKKATKTKKITAKVTKVKKVPKKKIVKKISKLKKVSPKKQPVKLKRVPHNPIISPRPYSWESKATFNPTAAEIDGKVHIIYRAIGDDDTSSLGHAVSKDGYNVDERATHFVYKRMMTSDSFCEPISYVSGGGWSGGCEDPRLSIIGDTVYMTYIAFDGWGSVRIAMTSISLEDFKNRKWKWKKPILLSPPGELHKNWVLFPEKIKGKFAVLHSISPKVLIDYISDWKEFDSGNKFIKSISHYDREADVRKTGIRGVGPSPIKTKDGWLVLYHAMEHSDPNRYKLFAMILDEKDPTKILYKSNGPILEPDLWYENEGYKWGVIYSCGAVVKDANLFVYYGGADMVACVASIPIKDLLNSLEKHKEVKLNRGKALKN